jgi:hypothetical protein
MQRWPAWGFFGMNREMIWAFSVTVLVVELSARLVSEPLRLCR